MIARRLLLLLPLLVALSACASAPSGSGRKLGRLPAAVLSTYGPVSVVLIDTLRDDDGRPLMAAFNVADRVIYIDRRVVDPMTQWRLLLHENCHVTLWDSGARAYNAIVDAFCDGVATAQLSALMGIPPIQVPSQASSPPPSLTSPPTSPR